jgi:hypothetical protein
MPGSRVLMAAWTEEELRLLGITRESVDDEAAVPVVCREPLAHHRLHQAVRDQAPVRDRAPDLSADLGVVLDIPAEDVPHADVLEVEFVGQPLGLRALSAALDAHDDVLVHRAQVVTAKRLGIQDWESIGGRS